MIVMMGHSKSNESAEGVIIEYKSNDVMTAYGKRTKIDSTVRVTTLMIGCSKCDERWNGKSNDEIKARVRIIADTARVMTLMTNYSKSSKNDGE